LANDVYVQVGIVMLIGLNAKLSIMIVEFARNKRDLEGFSTFEAATEGARLRFRAIVMTALAEVVGLMPLLLASGAGAAARWSVGTAIVAGMAMATLLSVFFIPVLYFAVITLTEKLGGRRAAAPQAGPGAGPGGPREAGRSAMRRQALFLIVALLLAGCTGPEIYVPPGEVPQEYRFQSLEGQPRPELNTLADLAWWEIFDDPELQNLIRTALGAKL
jgi:predicted RND superfamily exporter protein